jgi:hypothetical protein
MKKVYETPVMDLTVFTEGENMVTYASGITKVDNLNDTNIDIAF